MKKLGMFKRMGMVGGAMAVTAAVVGGIGVTAAQADVPLVAQDFNVGVAFASSSDIDVLSHVQGDGVSITGFTTVTGQHANALPSSLSWGLKNFDPVWPDTSAANLVHDKLLYSNNFYPSAWTSDGLYQMPVPSWDEHATYTVTDSSGATATGNITFNVGAIPVFSADSALYDETYLSFGDRLPATTVPTVMLYTGQSSPYREYTWNATTGQSVSVDLKDNLTITSAGIKPRYDSGSSEYYGGASFAAPMDYSQLPAGASLSSDLVFTYKAPAGVNGMVPICFTLNAASGVNTTRACFGPWITAAGPAPTAADSSVTTIGGHTTDVDVLASATGTDLTTTAVSVPVFGTATILPNGHVQYTAPASYVGPDSFTYTVTDGEGRLATATVTVNVLGALHVSDYSLTIGSTQSASQDISEALWVQLGAKVDLGAATTGTATISGTTITFAPNGVAGTSVIPYTVTDSFGRTASGELTVTMVAPPSGTEITASTPNNDPVTIDVPAIAGGTGTTIDSVTQPEHGTISLDGGLTYTPEAGYVGTDTFDVTLVDQYGQTVVVTVEVSVLPSTEPTPDPSQDPTVDPSTNPSSDPSASASASTTSGTGTDGSGTNGTSDSTLASTGAHGTMIAVTGGAILLAAGLVLLMARRRRENGTI